MEMIIIKKTYKSFTADYVFNLEEFKYIVFFDPVSELKIKFSDQMIEGCCQSFSIDRFITFLHSKSKERICTLEIYDDPSLFPENQEEEFTKFVPT